jgi:biopolymer transport protein TolR
MAMSLGGPDISGESDINSYKPVAEINVTPFVDVMLVLLIIFMVTAPLMMSGVPLELPKNSAASLSRPKEPIVVSITNEGKLFIRDSEVAGDQLIAQLRDARKGDPEAIVYVRGDKGLPYGRIMEVMGEIGQAGFARVSLVAEQKK